MGNQSTGIQSSGSRLSNRNQLNNSKFNSQENNQGNESSRQRRITVSKHNFELMYVIGRGGFGKVWKVIFKKDKLIYAMKEMAKTKIIDKKSESSVKYERDLLSKITHPFIVNMHYAFQDYDNLFIVMDFLTGGDMRYHISRHKRFTEEQTKFFMACILLSLEYLHNKNILHRDIKPENLVVDENGYLRLTDFGIAKLLQKENYTETSGTPGYMAPEVMASQNHGVGVDYFALGIIGYEFMLGMRPYQGKSRKEIKEQIMTKQAQIKKSDVPVGWSIEAADLINKLLIRKPANRLGFKGAIEIKLHEFFLDINWDDLLNKRIQSPFIPKNGDNFDKKYCEAPEKLGLDTLGRYENYMKSESFKQAFKNFTFINNMTQNNERSRVGSGDMLSSKYGTRYSTKKSSASKSNNVSSFTIEVSSGGSKYLNYIKKIESLQSGKTKSLSPVVSKKSMRTLDKNSSGLNQSSIKRDENQNNSIDLKSSQHILIKDNYSKLSLSKSSNIPQEELSFMNKPNKSYLLGNQTVREAEKNTIKSSIISNINDISLFEQAKQGDISSRQKYTKPKVIKSSSLIPSSRSTLNVGAAKLIKEKEEHQGSASVNFNYKHKKLNPIASKNNQSQVQFGNSNYAPNSGYNDQLPLSFTQRGFGKSILNSAGIKKSESTLNFKSIKLKN